MTHALTHTLRSYAQRTNALLAVLLLFTFSACEDDKEAAPVLPEPTINNVEVGLNNNEMGVIGRDFHLNAGFAYD